jgi:tetratricopeptide (TPR) repeat protein
MERRVVMMGALGVALIAFGGAAGAVQLRAPRNVQGTPASPQSAQLATRSATARASGRLDEALALAEQGIRADADDPWPYYNKAMALGELGRVDEAGAAFREAERRYFPGDLWGKSVAVYGRANTYAQAGRCAEANAAYADYTSLVWDYDAKSVDLVRRYAAECRPRVSPPRTPAQ